ncbi:hypothetical protein [Sphaerisporangium rhizosphaerae]|uniref:DUF4190 domain-containing protein n=1 Tax=Sphaerisporangium rhizosphaerae TaxID=2269375 RepID=A0ABW2P492_9ACTN
MTYPQQHGPQGHPQPYPQGYPQQAYMPPPGQPPYGYRPEPKNGLGLAAVIVGGIGILFGFVPLTFWVAGPLALTSIALGLAGIARVRRGTATNQAVSSIGLVLGVLAAGFSIWGAVTFFGALNDLSDSLKSPETRASEGIAELSKCFQDHKGEPDVLEKCTK